VSPARAGSRLAAQPRNIGNIKNEKSIEKFGGGNQSALAAAQKAIEAWASAWRQRDVDGYLAAYAQNYAGEQANVTREAWVKLRRQRILAHQSISIELADIELARNGKAVVATFTQNFRSNNLQDQARKRLTLVLTDGRWLIRREEVLR
jgi:ketosteroid isomerase-like protein